MKHQGDVRTCLIFGNITPSLENDKAERHIALTMKILMLIRKYHLYKIMMSATSGKLKHKVIN